MFDDFFRKANELVEAGTPFVTATVVRAENPTSAKPGDKAIVTVDGTMYGWIGGSCAQPTVIKEALHVLATDTASLVRLSTDPNKQTPREGLHDLPMTCFSGGTLEIYLEPQHPRPRLLIIGTLPVARALVQLASAMNYHVVVVDPDGIEEAQIPYANKVLTKLNDVVGEIRPFTYIIVATHGNYDELALAQILAEKPTYVGLVASPKRAHAVRDYLKHQGLSDLELMPLKAPAGLDIQARRGDEIALSIMAEIVQKRRNAELLDLALFQEPKSEADESCGCGCEDETTGDTIMIPLNLVATEHISMQTAVDPVCHMTVQIKETTYSHEHEGQTYYFCCAGCQQKFAQEPQAYLQRMSS